MWPLGGKNHNHSYSQRYSEIQKHKTPELNKKTKNKKTKTNNLSNQSLNINIDLLA